MSGLYDFSEVVRLAETQQLLAKQIEAASRDEAARLEQERKRINEMKALQFEHDCADALSADIKQKLSRRELDTKVRVRIQRHVPSTVTKALSEHDVLSTMVVFEIECMEKGCSRVFDAYACHKRLCSTHEPEPY